ncbi:MAG: hypothetical protein ACRCTP_00005 [Aeromonas popoffii]|uniref:hypothetical protein n=1 Tax=Aeromonas popoffii TaxID=70856 RepID=UPI003F3CD433
MILLDVLLSNLTHLILLTGDSSASIITAVETEMSGAEGENITLSCNYSSANTVQWYRQSHRSAPEFLFVILQATGTVLQKSKVVDSDPRFSAKVKEDKTQVFLKISCVKVTDSALYYCALQPTVTENTTTLYKNSLLCENISESSKFMQTC